MDWTTLSKYFRISRSVIIPGKFPHLNEIIKAIFSFPWDETRPCYQELPYYKIAAKRRPQRNWRTFELASTNQNSATCPCKPIRAKQSWRSIWSVNPSNRISIYNNKRRSTNCGVPSRFLAQDFHGFPRGWLMPTSFGKDLLPFLICDHEFHCFGQ